MLKSIAKRARERERLTIASSCWEINCNWVHLKRFRDNIIMTAYMVLALVAVVQPWPSQISHRRICLIIQSLQYCTKSQREKRKIIIKPEFWSPILKSSHPIEQTHCGHQLLRWSIITMIKINKNDWGEIHKKILNNLWGWSWQINILVFWKLKKGR